MNRNRRSVSKLASLKSAQRKGARPAGWRSKSNYFERLESRAMLAADAYQNAANQFDVNGDGHVTPMDALTIINDLNKYGSHPLTTLASDFATPSTQSVTAQASSAANFVDVNGDGVLSPLDALKVINALNSNDLVQVTLVAVNSHGVPISTIPVGSTFEIEALVADVSGSAEPPIGTALGAGGVFEAEIDGSYNSSLATIDPNATVTHGANYLNGPVSDLSTPGQIVGTGGFATGQVPLGPGQFVLWTIPVKATAAGVETFTPSPGTSVNSKGVGSEIAVFGNDNPIPSSQVDFEAGSVTIVPATTPIITISPATVANSPSQTVNEVFNVTLTNPSTTSPTTVTYSTADGTALAGTDYVGVTNGTVTFPAGATSENITVVVKANSAYNPSSTFTVNLSNPTNGAMIGTTQATGTITSDIDPPNFEISGPTAVVRQSSGVVNEVYTVTLVGPTELYAAVNYITSGTTTNPATPGTDYTPISGQLVFPVGTTSETITVPVLGNTSTTGSVGFNTNLRTPTNADVDTSAVTTIIGPPPTVDLSITKSDNKNGSSSGAVGNVTPGTPITYTITVSNSGPSTATGASVLDQLPGSITSDTWTAVGAGGASGFSSGTQSGNINDTALVLPANSSVTYTVVANVSSSATGTLSNTATVTAPAGVTDTNGANNSATDTDNLVQTADLSITKVDNKGGSSINNTTGSVAPGSTLTYTVVVQNNGPIAVTGAAVADALPAGISSDSWTAVGTSGASGFSTGTQSGAINDSNVSLAVGSKITYTIVATVATSASGTLTNIATVTGPNTPIDPNPANNSATDSDTVVQTADLSITKTDDQGGSSITHANGSVVPGTTVTYTIVVTNNGPSAANGVTVADSLPAAVVSDTWSAASSTGATGFTSTPTSGAIHDTAVNMPAGSIVTYTVVAHINSSATGSLSNTATVTAPLGVSDPSGANNTATDTDTLTPNADLSITKVDGNGGSSISGTHGSVTPGNPLVYTIVVSNAGPSSASGVTIADTLPAGISSDTWTATSGSGATGFLTSGSGAINASGVNLPSGSSITYTINANVSASAFGTLSNTATVTAAVGTTDPTPGNNSATDIDNLVPTADLSITKTDNKGGSSSGNTTGTASPGSTITYTITVTNAGPVEADGALVTDTLPAGILSDTYTATASGGATGFSTGVSGAISDTVNMPSGSSIVYTVTAVTDPAASGLLSNTAMVQAPGNLTDPNLANNSATDKVNLVPQTDLSITKVDNVGGSSIGNTIGTATNGGTITYTIVVTNAGPANATGATITDAMPAAFSSFSYTASATGAATGFTTSGAGSIHDSAVNIPVGSTITYVVTGQLASNFAGSVSNTATVAAPAGDSDPNTVNNSATDTDTVPGIADLVVTKSDNAGGSSSGATGTVIPGQQLVYTVVVTNNGPSDVTGASIVDTLPTGISNATYSAVATGGATGFKASGTGSIGDLAVNMPVGSTVTYTVTANVSSSATGTLSNTATASVPAGYTDPQTTNNSATDTDNLTPTADLSITKFDNVGGSSVTGAVGNVVKGQSITYTIVVTNNGPSTATGTSIVDSLPAAIASDTFSAVATGGASNFTASGSGNISDANVTLPAGSTVTYTIVALVSTSTTSTTMSNVATVAAGTGVVDTNSANNSATDVDNVAVFTPSSLSGTEFIDSDGNGLRGTSELEVQNATIHLTGTDFLSNAVSLTTNTAADGSYSFGNLNPGTYTITAVQSQYLTAGQAIVGTEGGTAPDANDIKVTIGAAGGVTGTGNNFTEKSFASAAISERILLASSHMNGTVDLNNTNLFPSTASASVASPSASPAVSSSMLLASSAVASAPSATSAVDAAFADPRLLD